MKIIDTDIPDLKVIEPKVFSDDRGYFLETWNAQGFAQAGLNWTFVQDNQSKSRRNVVRGLHYQIQSPQAKLVRVVTGAIYDVAVDLRRGSPTFGRWAGVELSEDNHRMMLIPVGFAHGFLSLTDETQLVYKCTDFYASQHERTIMWNDPDLAIAWPLVAGEQPLVSSKDVLGRPLKEADVFA
jgi:dTDP-4-dehydrorhamnose 3,5-epimerase